MILWVCLGPRGDYKERPVVVLTLPDKDGRFRVVAASSQASPGSNNEVELPWASDRHPLTKLKKRTVAITDWIVAIDMSAVREIKGRVPSKTLVEIQEKVSGHIAAGPPEPK
jgi:mRNA-degrading endonuclease toxin of MazEF toxin-antitoxin module